MKTCVRRLSVWTCAAGVVVSVAACDNTAIGIKRDTEINSKKAAIKASGAADRATQATSAAARTATVAAEAAAQTVNVKTALLTDKRVAAKGIDVDTDGTTRTVTLRGRVPSDDQRAIAEQIAIERSSGYRVRNELTIGN
jgi:hyperosmotically inducible periplasmic protein